MSRHNSWDRSEPYALQIGDFSENMYIGVSYRKENEGFNERPPAVVKVKFVKPGQKKLLDSVMHHEVGVVTQDGHRFTIHCRQWTENNNYDVNHFISKATVWEWKLSEKFNNWLNKEYDYQVSHKLEIYLYDTALEVQEALKAASDYLEQLHQQRIRNEIEKKINQEEAVRRQAEQERKEEQARKVIDKMFGAD